MNFSRMCSLSRACSFSRSRTRALSHTLSYSLSFPSLPLVLSSSLPLSLVLLSPSHTACLSPAHRRVLLHTGQRTPTQYVSCFHTLARALSLSLFLSLSLSLSLSHTHTTHTHTQASKDSENSTSEGYACGVITMSRHLAVGRRGARGAGRGRDGERWQTVKMTWTSPLPSPRVERTEIMSTDAIREGQTNGASPDGSKTSQSSSSCHSALHSPALRSFFDFCF